MVRSQGVDPWVYQTETGRQRQRDPQRGAVGKSRQWLWAGSCELGEGLPAACHGYSAQGLGAQVSEDSVGPAHIINDRKGCLLWNRISGSTVLVERRECCSYFCLLDSISLGCSYYPGR